MRRVFYIFGAAALVSTSAIRPARAWYDHTAVMDRVQIRLEREIPTPGEAGKWSTPLPADTVSPTMRYYDLAGLLLLQSKAATQLKSLGARTPHDLLRLGSEDPDHGIDAELPDSADPNDDRKYMGGTKGSSSQGFRHMFWPGWNFRKPFSTLQFPIRALGQAPDRIDLLANEARDRIRKGDYAWGIRILGWTLHYLQDLTQPFHAVQVPTPKMIPWRSILVWPPKDALDTAVRETTRVVTNYHWAYEGYVRHALLQGDTSPLRECFEKTGGSILVNSPRELALEIANRSISRAKATGDAVVALVGTHLKDDGVSVPLNPSQIDVADLLKNPSHEAARTRLNTLTCESLRLSTDASIWITRWVFGR